MILLLAPGPIKYSFVKTGVEYFLKLLSRWVKIKGEFPRLKGSFPNKESRLLAEENLLSKFIPQEAFLVILDEQGQSLDTQGFSLLLKELLLQKKTIVFLIGGPEGISTSPKKKATLTLKLSDLTLNHERALLILAEALFRAISLLKGHPYHRN